MTEQYTLLKRRIEFRAPRDLTRAVFSRFEESPFADLEGSYDDAHSYRLYQDRTQNVVLEVMAIGTENQDIPEYLVRADISRGGSIFYKGQSTIRSDEVKKILEQILTDRTRL